MAILGSTKVTDLTLLDGVIGNLNPVDTGVYDLGTSSLKWRYFYGDLKGNADSSSAVKDNGNGTLTKFQYSASGMATTSWLGSWDGYTLKAITPANAVKAGIGTTAIGKVSLPIYWDGSKFATITSYEGKAATAGTADTATNFGKGSHAAAVTANEFTLTAGYATLVGNVSNTTMPHTNNANAEMIIKAHPTSGTNYYEARFGFSSNQKLYYMPVSGTNWKLIADIDYVENSRIEVVRLI